MGVGPLLVDETIERTLTVCNLTVDSVNPAGSIAWDGSTAPAPITVNLRDNDLNDPMDVTLSISSCADDPESPSFAGRTITLTNVTGASHIFNWDGKDGNENDAEPGLYTYEVNVSQTDVNNTYSELEVADQTNYRSNYLNVLRARDDEQNPIYDVEYEGYDDNGTPDYEDDDNYLYLIRWYSLQDTGNPLKNASSGTLTLYDPDFQVKGNWSVASLQCVEHSATDGLVASGTGLKHGLRVPVSIAMMVDGGTYRFVLHMVDDHAAEYRDHTSNRPALDLNSKNKVYAVNFYYGGGLRGSATGGLSEAWQSIKRCVALAPDNRYYGLGKGRELREGKLVSMVTIPENADAHVVVSGLMHGQQMWYAPSVFAVYAHGYGGQYAGKAMRIHKSVINNCAITSNVWVDDIGSHESQARLCDLLTGSLQACAIGVLAGCHTDEGSRSIFSAPNTLSEYLRLQGVQNVVGFVGAIPDIGGAIFVRKFFTYLKTRLSDGREVLETGPRIEQAATMAAKEVQQLATQNDTWGRLMPATDWVKLNGVFLDTQ